MAFRIDLPPGYPLTHLLRSLGRDPVSVTERLDVATYEAAVDLEGVPAVMRIQFSQDGAAVSLDGSGQTSATAQRVAAHRLVIGMLGLDQDAAGFARLARRLGLARLVAGRPGLRLIQHPERLGRAAVGDHRPADQPALRLPSQAAAD